MKVVVIGCTHAGTAAVKSMLNNKDIEEMYESTFLSTPFVGWKREKDYFIQEELQCGIMYL